jgi:hypothetical protein
VWTLAAYGFDDAKALFEKMVKYDHELFNE